MTMSTCKSVIGTHAMLVLTALSAASVVHAQEAPQWFLRGGPAYAGFDASAHVYLPNGEVPGGDASVRHNTGFAMEFGYFIAPNWSAALSVGVPPTARIYGAGTLDSAGKLGNAKYAPGVLSLQFNAPTEGPLRPYIGLGYNYTIVYDVQDSAIHHLRVSNGGGPSIQAGFEYAVSPRFALFLDIKKIWVGVDAHGQVETPSGAVPAYANVTLNPVIINTGLSWHF